MSSVSLINGVAKRDTTLMVTSQGIKMVVLFGSPVMDNMLKNTKPPMYNREDYDRNKDIVQTILLK